MKQLISKLLLFVFILPTFVSAQIGSDSEARRKNVERGLLPGVLIKGDPSWSIEERMKFYKVPGQHCGDQRLQDRLGARVRRGGRRNEGAGNDRNTISSGLY